MQDGLTYTITDYQTINQTKYVSTPGVLDLANSRNQGFVSEGRLQASEPYQTMQ